jgi:hypothetical protein
MSNPARVVEPLSLCMTKTGSKKCSLLSYDSLFIQDGYCNSIHKCLRWSASVSLDEPARWRMWSSKYPYLFGRVVSLWDYHFVSMGIYSFGMKTAPKMVITTHRFQGEVPWVSTNMTLGTGPHTVFTRAQLLQYSETVGKSTILLYENSPKLQWITRL